MAEEQEEFDTTPGYKPPEKVDLETLQQLDQDDEALNRWKATLLGGASSSGPHDDPRRVIVEQMAFVTQDRDEMVIDLTGDLSKLKESPFVIKEGCQFRIKIYFKVQHEIVAGLRYVDGVYRKGVRVGKNNYMLGNYGPKDETQVALTPWDEMPSGMLARGHYKVKSRFIDDDKQEHLAWEWAFDLKKDW